MYLKRLDINGFKSFASRTVLDFLPDCALAEGGKCGITAIVGPNGSGKSNVADAIRWAIGEQSLKNLRGKKSEDVIFAGTDQKTRLGSASVTLHFDNSDKRIPIEFAEVSVTRKVFRSGESEYLINGSPVRLMDIVDLLAQAGIGKDSYCVITQGMSDAVLSATPVERRAVFEDAAGVKPFQIEKERALRKLGSTRENLVRVDGLTAEIEPHLRNLKRQAEKAAQGKEIATRLRARQELLYGYLWHNFQGERGGLVQERDAAERQVFDLEVETNTLQKVVAEASASMHDEQEEETFIRSLAEVRDGINAILRERSVIDGRIEIEREKRKDREVVRVIPVDLAYVRTALDDIRARQAELIARIKDTGRIEDLQTIREFAQVIGQKLSDLHARAGEGSVRETTVVTLPDEERQASDVRLAALATEKETFGTRLAAAEKALAEQEAGLTALREAGKAHRATFFAKEEEWRDKEHRLTRLKDSLNEVRVRLARVEVREEDLVNLVREELSQSVDDLRYDGTPVEREKLEREISRLKVEVEQVGGIDPLVIQEYEETEKRYALLTRESADLKQAMLSLDEVVREMDRKIDHVFQEAFREIRRKFEEYFKIIFGGGKAEIEIVRLKRRRTVEGESEPDEEEVSAGEAVSEDIGIEISACPPGKKITHLSMLSGGERSLTSLALLFAIIAHNPPPFAVLDEVEAALDEANSRRFSKMLNGLSDHTQFIAITHNRETMAQAGLLYGVTMGADGVSQLLSIRLDQVAESGQALAAGKVGSAG